VMDSIEQSKKYMWQGKEQQAVHSS
jgi:hypothetical protein